MGLVSLSERGWIKFDNDPDILDWVHYIQPTAAGIAKDPKQKALWLRHGDTWFVGVNSLPNDPAGSVAEGPQLKGTGCATCPKTGKAKENLKPSNSTP